jgi:hypothetical protein
VDDAADDPPIILPVSARPVPRQMRLDLRPLFVSEPELLSHDQAPLRSLNHASGNHINNLIGFSP